MQRREDYHFELPDELIAQTPADRRDASRLLVLPALDDRRFSDIVELLPADAVLVVNDTRVIPARVHTRKESGGNVELLFVEPAGENLWRCMARARRPLAAGQRLHPCVPGKRGVAALGGPVLTLRSGRAEDTTVVVEVPGEGTEFLDTWGEIPLPHYIQREDARAEDRERYQTVYARVPGAVAAPTAGLHFTAELLAACEARGMTIARVTLHVGLGTFTPVRVSNLDEHVMHRERYEVPEATAALVASGRPVVAVGTTVVRTLESAATGDHAVTAGPGETRLFIRPGYQFRVVDHLITNFHLPESTLLMLVCAFAGTELTMRAYAHAVEQRYRFFSYGDAMYL